jgi:putative addiction module killer protein
MEARDRTVVYYSTIGAKVPFREWRSGITDNDTKAAIDARIARLRGGNFGKSEPIGGGASESKIDFGPGYRIYYGLDGNELVVLLCGGDKSTQDSDIRRAKRFWGDYKERKKGQLAARKKSK